MDSMRRPCAIVTLLLALALAAPISRAAQTAPPAHPIFGDFDRELRTADGHFDTPGMIAALKEMGVNTYVYQIWHRATDWEDLPAFAAAARRESISVWVWIMPWSMTPLQKRAGHFSEPFRTDYVRWAREIARLSLEHDNIVGYIIDDFNTNTHDDRFSPGYVARMVAAGREINPRIKFYPQLYFEQPWAKFMERFGDLIDGAVVAYPASEAEIDNALNYLRDRSHGISFVAGFPKKEPALVGDGASISADLRVTDARHASLSFYWDHTDRSDLAGFRQGYVRVNGRTIWSGDAGSRSTDRHVRLDLSSFAAGRRSLHIEMGVTVTRKARFPLTTRIDDIRLTGLAEPDASNYRDVWRMRHVERIPVELSPPSGRRTGRFELPMILMPSAEVYEHEMRFSEPASAQNVARKLELCLDAVRDGKAQGVITYCAPKDAADPLFKVVRDAYARVGRARWGE
jgi:hypothetical protein